MVDGGRCACQTFHCLPCYRLWTENVASERVEKGFSRLRNAGETACATSALQEVVHQGGAGIQPAKAFFDTLSKIGLLMRPDAGCNLLERLPGTRRLLA